MADFEIAFDETMLNEGGYVHDPDDRGGETYRGVARAIHPHWTGWTVVDQLKLQSPSDFRKHLDEHQTMQDLVRDFYRKEFWEPLNGDQITAQHLANELFDTGVNQGVKSAIRYWQEALNLLNRNGRDYQDILVDGISGAETLSTTQKFLDRQNGKPDSLLKVLNLMQGNRYLELARKNPTQRKFLHGWLTRVKLN